MSNTTNYLFEKLPKGYQNYDVPINENFDKIDTEIKNRANEIGTLSNLETTDKTSTVNATNEIVHKIGVLSQLPTTDKTNIVNSIKEVNTQLEETTKSLSDFVNILDYGAKLDGVTDDSHAFELALADGNVSLPPNSTIYIGETVHINDSKRIIDFKESLLIGGNGVIMFQIGSLDLTAPLINITLKNAFVDLVNAASFLLSYNSYFITASNLRLSNLNGSNFGLKFINGFNLTFREVHINGKDSGAGNISGNYAKGISIEPNTNVSSGVSGTGVITNVLIDSCLIQRVQYGIYFGYTSGTMFDTNKISNVGFSNVDNVITTFETSLNLKISGLRCEYCGTLLDNNGDIFIEDIYCYETTYSFYNKINGNIMLSGGYYHWNPNKTGGYLIKDNAGFISFKDLSYFNYTANVSKCEGSYGTISQKKANSVRTPNGLTTLSIDPFEIKTYDQTGYLDFSNVSGNNGSEFYIYSSTNANFSLPNDTYVFNEVKSNRMLHCKILNGTIQIIGQDAFLYSKTHNGTTLSNPKQRIEVVNALYSLTQFTFDKLGLTLLCSKTSGVTLSNGNGKILNFNSINSGNPIDLYNKCYMLVSLGDGSGNGFILN